MVTDFDARDMDNSDNCKHLCLFCYSHLPSGYLKATTLENEVPFGDKLVIQLDNPSRNVEAFDILCVLLRVDWRRSRINNGSLFDDRKSLPLCSRCQNIYQELFQLHVQIKELEKQLNKRAGFIRGLIQKTEKGAKLDSEIEVQSQLTLLGLDLFRQKVLGTCSNETNESVAVKSIPKVVSVPGPSSQLSTNIPKADDCGRVENFHPPPPGSTPVIVKEEICSVQELEDNFCLGDTAPWMGNGLDNSSKTIVETYPSADENSMDAGSVFGEDDAMSIEDSGSDFEAEEKVHIKTTVQTRRITRNSSKSQSNADNRTGTSDSSENEEDEEQDDYINDDDSSNSEEGEGEDNTSDEEFELPKSHKKSSTKSPPTRLRRRMVSIPRKEFECHICSAVIIGQNAVTVHYSEVHPDHKKYTCTFCQKYFSKRRDCIIHQRNKHTGDKPFQCPSCPSAFAAAKLLRFHELHQHTNRSNIAISCSKCSLEFSTRTLLTNHLVDAHGYKRRPKKSRAKHPPKTYSCHLCDEAITGQSLFIQHYKDVHPEENRFTCKFCQRHFNRLRECRSHQMKHTGERPLQCNFCEKSYRDKKSLLHHQRYVHKEGPVTYHYCPTCGKQFSNTGSLTYHMYSHSDAVVFCKMCGRNFKNPNYFGRHNRKVHDGKAKYSEPISNPSKEILESLGIPIQEPSVKCHRCWSLFTTKGQLKSHFSEEHPDHQGGLNTCQCGKQFAKYKECCRHAMRHNGAKTFQCDQCPLSFYSGRELRLHAQTHIPVEERKNHICDVCGLGVVSENALTNHKKTHDANQPRWVCEQCGKSYSRKKGLIFHTKVEHLKIVPFQCKQCGKPFACTNDLTKHERSHSKAKPFKCPLCGKCFPYTSSRRRHLREVHKVEGDVKMHETEGRAAEGTQETEHKPDVTVGIDTVTQLALL